MNGAIWRELTDETEHRRAYRLRHEVEADPTTIAVDPGRLRLALLGYRSTVLYSRLELAALWYQKPPNMKVPHQWRITDLRSGVSRITSEEATLLSDVFDISVNDLTDPTGDRISNLEQKIEKLADLALARGASGAEIAKALA